MHAFDRGVTIRSKHGFFLAIPTAAAGAKGAGRQADHARRLGAADRHAAALRLSPQRGPSLLVADDARLDQRAAWRAAKRGRRRRDGILTGAQTVPIFLLVPQVKLRKRLDLDRAASAARRACRR